MILGDQCPMNFDDGSNPWLQTEFFVQVLDVGAASNVYSPLTTAGLLLISLSILWKLVL